MNTSIHKKIYVYVKIYNVSDDCSFIMAVSCAAVNFGLQSLGITGNSAKYIPIL